MKNRFAMVPILLSVFVDLIGVGIVIPVLSVVMLDPKLGMFALGTLQSTKEITLGFLIASYPFAQFFGAPIIGAYSDRIGRKKALLISFFGSCVGYVLFGYGLLIHHIPLLFISRIIDGFTGGNISVAMSAIADISTKKTKVANFGLIGAAFGMGLVFGPFIGGKLSDPLIHPLFNHATPFWFAAMLVIVNMFLIIFLFKETLHTKIRYKISLTTGFKNIAKAMKLENLRIMFIVVFLLFFGFNFFTQFFSVYLIEKFSFTSSQIGDFYGFLGIWIVLTQGIVTRPVAKRFSSSKILSVSIFMLSIALICLLIPKESRILYFIIPFVALSNGLIRPNSTAIISDMATEDSQGEILGITASVQALAMTIPPIISGFLVALHLTYPIIIASLLTAVAGVVFIVFYHNKTGKRFTEV
ncbi:MAG: MFS transporter [Nanoarchaeota archaeon]|nr:MFS transporter [Nanoarchaeota archaeon]